MKKEDISEFSITRVTDFHSNYGYYESNYHLYFGEEGQSLSDMEFGQLVMLHAFLGRFVETEKVCLDKMNELKKKELPLQPNKR